MSSKQPPDAARGKADTSQPQAAGTRQGVVPEGIWVLDQQRSRKLEPCSHTLWVIKDDGVELRWVSVETGEDGIDKITSWAGEYDGGPSTVSGSGFVVRLRKLGPNKMQTYGEIPEMGPFSETCEVDPSGTSMVCNGKVETSDGTLTWLEVFDLHSASPHLKLQTSSKTP
jgi:hypothetical protein